MSAPLAVRHWTFASDTSPGGIELLGPPCSAATLGAALDAACAALPMRDPAFLLVRLERTNRAGVEAAVQLASAFSATARVCLAIDRCTLAQLESQGLDTSNVGLLLDGVDADTPPSAVVHYAIEAIRFGPDFVAQAARNIRLGCALEAMVGLARNLGLATLGPAAAAEGWCLPGIAFDYALSGSEDQDTQIASD
jgi:hypothetical protein